MRIMAVDLGKARTGIAISDPSGFLASPVRVISEGYRPRLLEQVCEAAKTLGAERIVVGLPLNMNGSEGESALAARAFGTELHELTGLEVIMWDERCTTVSAHSILSETNTRGKKRKAVVDAVAAVVILQSYLDSI